LEEKDITMSKTTTHKPQRSHDDAVIELLRTDPTFATEYLSAALDEEHLEGGKEALLAALRQITKAQGFGNVAEKAGVPRESIYRALSPSGNPRITTLLGILKATGLKLTVQAA
jgi:probable addiction module antidote protein